jgi:hypothetical protein
MKVPFKIVELINIVALLFLLIGGYGLPFTGGLQVLAAVLFLTIFPKNKLIYIYFGLVIFFFLLWDRHSFGWLFLLPIALLFFLTYIIYNQKTKL